MRIAEAFKQRTPRRGFERVPARPGSAGRSAHATVFYGCNSPFLALSYATPGPVGVRSRVQ